MTHWKNLRNCAYSEIQASSCLLLSMADNYMYAMRYSHRSVGVISQSFLNLWHLLHSGYKRHKHTRPYTPLHVLYVDINPQDFTLSLKVYSQGKKLKLELKTKEKALTKKETGIIHRLSAFKISAQLIIHRFKNFTDVKKFWSF